MVPRFQISRFWSLPLKNLFLDLPFNRPTVSPFVRPSVFRCPLASIQRAAVSLYLLEVFA